MKRGPLLRQDPPQAALKLELGMHNRKYTSFMSCCFLLLCSLFAMFMFHVRDGTTIMCLKEDTESWRNVIVESLSMYGLYVFDWIVCGLVWMALYKLTAFCKRWRSTHRCLPTAQLRRDVRRWINAANGFQWIAWEELNSNGTEMDFMWNLPHRYLSVFSRIDDKVELGWVKVRKMGFVWIQIDRKSVRQTDRK